MKIDVEVLYCFGGLFIILVILVFSFLVYGIVYIILKSRLDRLASKNDIQGIVKALNSNFVGDYAAELLIKLGWEPETKRQKVQIALAKKNISHLKKLGALASVDMVVYRSRYKDDLLIRSPAITPPSYIDPNLPIRKYDYVSDEENDSSEADFSLVLLWGHERTGHFSNGASAVQKTCEVKIRDNRKEKDTTIGKTFKGGKPPKKVQILHSPYGGPRYHAGEFSGKNVEGYLDSLLDKFVTVPAESD